MRHLQGPYRSSIHALDAPSSRLEPSLATSGMAVTLGSVGVIGSSIAYALSGFPTAFPLPPGAWLQGWNAMQVSSTETSPLWWAGTLGLTLDVVLAAGALLIGLALLQRGRAREALGWVLISMASLGFITIDALAGRVLPLLAQSPWAAPTSPAGAMATYAGARTLFDSLFATGTFALGLGLWWVNARGTSTLPLLRVLGRLLGAVTTVVAFLGVIGWNTGPSQGLCVALGASLLCLIGLQLWRRGIL